MAISLKKNSGGITLDKGLNNVVFKFIWGNAMDIDASVMVLTDGKAGEDADFVFYGNLEHPSGAIKHSGDIKGGGEEHIEIALKDIPPIKNEVVLIASINNAVNRGQHFGKAENSVCQLVDADTNEILVEYKPSKDLIGEICARIAKLHKEGTVWKVSAIGEGVSGLDRIVLDVGLTLADE
jgi:tellurium resistance protein TerD